MIRVTGRLGVQLQSVAGLLALVILVALHQFVVQVLQRIPGRAGSGAAAIFGIGLNVLQ